MLTIFVKHIFWRTKEEKILKKYNDFPQEHNRIIVNVMSITHYSVVLHIPPSGKS